MEELYKEVAYISYHFHWQKEQILEMTHNERHTWAREISEINDRINNET